jgi:hypothetical protein
MRTKIVFVVLACCAGCYPESYVSRPGASGKIVDAATSQPIEGAVVRMQGPLDRAGVDRYRITKRTTTMEGRSGAHGEFSLRPTNELGWNLIAPRGTRAAPLGLLQVDRDGYGLKSLLVINRYRDGVIRMTREAPATNESK